MSRFWQHFISYGFQASLCRYQWKAPSEWFRSQDTQSSPPVLYTTACFLIHSMKRR